MADYIDFSASGGAGGGAAVTDRSHGLEYGWLLLSVLSLGFAGIFALMLALARTPGVPNLLPLGGDYIYVALVTHVTLAFVIFFLAFIGFLLVKGTGDLTCSGKRYGTTPAITPAGLLLSAVGMTSIIVSALLGLGDPILANYLPVLKHPLFLWGLVIFFSGLLINVAAFFVVLLRGYGNCLSVTTYGLTVAALTVVVAFVCFGLSLIMQLKGGGGMEAVDFEQLVWGGGHILQSTNTVTMFTLWFLLYSLGAVSGGRGGGGDGGGGRGHLLGTKGQKVLLLLPLLAALPMPLFYFAVDTGSQEYRTIFTREMALGLFPTITALCAYFAYRLFIKGDQKAPTPGVRALKMSLILFTLGSLASLAISGYNTKTPAHYHLVIGGVTIAFMGLFYEVLPSIGRRVRFSKAGRRQPYIYGAGVALFAIGLFIAGTHGVERKTYGGDQNLDNIVKLAGMATMGVGGIVAVTGGVLFIFNGLASLMPIRGKCGGKEGR